MKELLTAAGKQVPLVGLGTFPLQGRELAQIVTQAVEIGYRIFDTSDDYRGETGIGMACRTLLDSHFIKREEMFLQTKISRNGSYKDEPLFAVYFNKYSNFMKRHSVKEVVKEKVGISLRELKTDYLDSLLIHLPYTDYYEEIWEVMVELKKQGVVRYIGVSNFHIEHIEKLKKGGVTPDINQIYISPIGSKQEMVDYAKASGIQLMSYSPLLDIPRGRIDATLLKPIMNKYNKSLAQIILRWNIERGVIPLPKTKNKERLKENIDVFDFFLTEEEVNTISSLNKNYQYLIESKMCPGI